MTSYEDIMIDNETGGTSVRAPIFSIGAVLFNRHDPIGAFGPEFHYTLDADCQPGRVWNQDTIRWWVKQGNRAKESLKGETPNTRFVLLELFKLIEEHKVKRVWSWHVDFDIGQLNELARLEHLDWPLSHRTTFDCPSYIDQCPISPRLVPVAHHALDDCIAQLASVQEAFHFKAKALAAYVQDRSE